MRKLPWYLSIYLLIMLTIVLSCVVGFKNFYIWRDVDTYWAYYDFAYFYNVSYIFSNVQDPIFTILIKPFVHSGRSEGFHLFLIVIAFVTISLKLISMYKRCQNFYIFYCCIALIYYFFMIMSKYELHWLLGFLFLLCTAPIVK